MNTSKLIPLVMSMLLVSPMAKADNIIRMQAPIQGGSIEQADSWLPWTDEISDWAAVGTPTLCSNWAPLANTVAVGASFTQTATDCQQLQQRTIQPTERNDKTLVVRNAGTPTVETKTVTVSATQTVVGTQPIGNTAEFLVTVGNISTQWGYMTNTSRGTLISSTNPNYVLSYVSLGFQNQVLVGLVGQQPQSAFRYKSIKIQMLNSAGAVFYTMSSDSILNNYAPAPYYVGWAHNATDYANAKVASRFIVTLSFR